MGPILQERTASAILKRVPVKEKIRVKNSENTAIVTSNNLTGGKVSQSQKPQKKTSLLHKNVISGQGKEPFLGAEIKGQHRNRTKQVKSPISGTYKMSR
ncbi:protein FAM, partial [Clarias magur]